MNTKIETLKDYPVNSRLDIDWCKHNLKLAKENIHLPKRYSKAIKNKLFEGLHLQNIITGNSTFRRFDYPLKYIQNVMNQGIDQWNKWVILCACEFNQEEFEDAKNLLIFSASSKIKQNEKVSPRRHIEKWHKLKRKSSIVRKSKSKWVLDD